MIVIVIIQHNFWLIKYKNKKVQLFDIPINKKQKDISPISLNKLLTPPPPNPCCIVTILLKGYSIEVNI